MCTLTNQWIYWTYSQKLGGPNLLSVSVINTMTKSDWWGSTSSYTLEFIMQNRNSKNLEVGPEKEKDCQFILHFLLSLLSYTAQDCISIGLDCLYWIGPSDTNYQSRKCPTLMSAGTSDRSNASTEALSSQMTVVCVKLTNNNHQHMGKGLITGA